MNFDAAAHVAHMETMLGLTIAPEWRASVVANMRAIAGAADLVMTADLDETIEPALVFEP